jgi:hypothetical protein
MTGSLMFPKVDMIMCRYSGLFTREFLQRGAAALPISILLLFVAALVLIAVSKTNLMEQRISGNEIRARQAMQAAQAGVSHAAAYMKAGGIDHGPNSVADSITPVTLTNGSSYQVYYCDPDVNPPVDACDNASSRTTCTGGFTAVERFATPLVLACGWSDDGLAKQPVVVSISRASSLADAPDNPVISKGGINVQGSATITNYFTNLTIWTGDPFIGVGNSGKTFVRNPKVPQPAMTATPPDRPTACKESDNYICLTDKSIRGPDIIDNDLKLKNMSDEEMFEQFFGNDFATYRDDIATRTIAAGQAPTLADIEGESVVITGASSGVSLPSMGTRESPVVVIVEGNLSQTGNTTIYGVVYVMGDMSGSGNFTVYGNVSVEGVVESTGSLDIIFDPFAISNSRKLGKPGLLSGSWRDWL